MQADGGTDHAAQRAAIEDMASSKGDVIADWFEDAGISGTVSPKKRPALAQALERLRAHEADGLVVAKLDRLSRSVSDFTRLLKQAEREGWALVILDLGVDTSSAMGRFVSHVIASVAELERDMIAGRTRDALAAKRAEGWRPGVPLTPDHVRTDIAARRAAGSTLQAIADDLNAAHVPTSRGGTEWRVSSVRSVLKSVERDAA